MEAQEAAEGGHEAEPQGEAVSAVEAMHEFTPEERKGPGGLGLVSPSDSVAPKVLLHVYIIERKIERGREMFS